jgi:hypothetical protein
MARGSGGSTPVDKAAAVRAPGEGRGHRGVAQEAGAPVKTATDLAAMRPRTIWLRRREPHLRHSRRRRAMRRTERILAPCSRSPRLRATPDDDTQEAQTIDNRLKTGLGDDWSAVHCAGPPRPRAWASQVRVLWYQLLNSRALSSQARALGAGAHKRMRAALAATGHCRAPRRFRRRYTSGRRGREHRAAESLRTPRSAADANRDDLATANLVRRNFCKNLV